ncbi:MAG: hypothetical protein IPJ88_11920 [Myxococcales bacterium]|nr:MAG: hypothetical protein IPJ88_11920 [Myxococcales bacterium]
MMEERAFESHPSCYVASGLCNLPWKQILSVLQVIIDPDLVMKVVETIKQTIETAKKPTCTDRIVRELLAAFSWINYVANNQPENRDELRDLLVLRDIPVDNIPEYISYAFSRLTDQPANKTTEAMRVYTSIYSRVSEDEVSLAKARDRCVSGKTKDKKCEKITNLAGSRRALRSLKELPKTIDPKIIAEVSAYKKSLEVPSSGVVRAR